MCAGKPRTQHSLAPQEIMAGNGRGDRTEGLKSGLSWWLPRPVGSALSVSASLSDPMQSEEQLESMLRIPSGRQGPEPPDSDHVLRSRQSASWSPGPPDSLGSGLRSSLQLPGR